MKRFENRTVLVTGAGTGIGKAVAERFAKEGADVLILGRTEETLIEALKSENISYVVADLEKNEDIKKVIRKIENDYGKLDILINNAGWAPVTHISEVTIDKYDKVFGINVRALVNLTIQALPLLKQSKGNIINMSSVICKNHLLNMSMYARTSCC